MINQTPLLFKLHWLPIRERILFKILLITYKAVHGHAPNYIKELIKFKSLENTTLGQIVIIYY